MIRRLEEEARLLEEQNYRLRIENAIIRKATELISKKAGGIDIRQLRNREKILIVDALSDYKTKDLLDIISLPRSSYYYCRKASRYDKYKEERAILHQKFYDCHQCYGYRRMYVVLKREGAGLGEKVVRRLMREEGLVVARKKKRHRFSTYKGEISPAVENIVNRDFHAGLPNQKWLTDISEFCIPAGKIYLSPIIDCFDGMVVSWNIGTSPDAALVNTMLDDAISKLPSGEHPVIHSDRGSHYMWPGWIDRMERHGLVRSMSKKGCSPDNSACEGFFGRLKNEMFYGRRWKNVSIDSFMNMLDSYIHWYNRERIKMSLGGLSPVQYRRKLNLIA